MSDLHVDGVTQAHLELADHALAHLRLLGSVEASRRSVEQLGVSYAKLPVAEAARRLDITPQTLALQSAVGGLKWEAEVPKAFSLAIPLSVDGPQIGIIPGRENPVLDVFSIDEENITPAGFGFSETFGLNPRCTY